MAIDPNAFVIVQEAHQVLGDGFSNYSSSPYKRERVRKENPHET